MSEYFLKGLGEMKLQQALEVNRDLAVRGGKGFDAFLACGSTPLHLQTFLTACLAQRLPTHRISCRTGPYGDLMAALDAARTAAADGIAVVLEWSDLDARLGLRRLGGWTTSTLADVVLVAERRLEELQTLLASVKERRVAMSLPSLPLPPAFLMARSRSSVPELELRQLVSVFATCATRIPNVAVVNPAYIDAVSPFCGRRDIKSELFADFPFTVEHASALAEALAQVLAPRPPLKGLITDLDDTLWRGLLGEIGSERVSWTLDDRSHVHGIYQQMLHSLADSGTLVAVASKNEPAVVEAALARSDLLICRERIYPIEVGWHAKSESVARILSAWNIGADAAVFVDDSPLELAEVQARFPEMTCLLFPTNKEAGVLELIGKLRDLFGKEEVSTEDRLRVASVKAMAAQQSSRAAAGSSEQFLAQLDGEVEARFAKMPVDTRIFELINKTNQFNLNGQRMGEAEWHRFLNRPDSFLLSVSYRDKFGPLGKIGAAFGRLAGDDLLLDGWVLSCRAFARRIEHAMLKLLLDTFVPMRVVFAFSPTARNSPAVNFLHSLGVGVDAGAATISASAFAERCPRLYPRIVRNG